MNKLDEIDYRMLEVLQTDGRIHVLELADRVGLSPTPCSRRLRRLESEGIIAKYYAAVNPKTIGLDVMAFVSVRVRHSAAWAAQFATAIHQMSKCSAVIVLLGITTICYGYMPVIWKAFRAGCRTSCMPFPRSCRRTPASSWSRSRTIPRSPWPLGKPTSTSGPQSKNSKRSRIRREKLQ